MRKTALATVLLAMAGTCAAIDADDLGYPASESIPPYVMEALRKLPNANALALSASINPCYLQGDFNGDQRLDSAVLVREKSSGKTGIAVIDGASARVSLLGAGHELPDSGDDFGWMDAWYVFPKSSVGQGATDDAPPELRGDAIMAIKTESASGLIYWNGKRFAWYQQGD